MDSAGTGAWGCLWHAICRAFGGARGLAHNRAGARDDCCTQWYEIEREVGAYLGYTPTRGECAFTPPTLDARHGTEWM